MKLQIVKKLLLVLIGTFFIIGSVEAEAIGLEQSRKELQLRTWESSLDTLIKVYTFQYHNDGVRVFSLGNDSSAVIDNNNEVYFAPVPSYQAQHVIASNSGVNAELMCVYISIFIFVGCLLVLCFLYIKMKRQELNNDTAPEDIKYTLDMMFVIAAFGFAITFSLPMLIVEPLTQIYMQSAIDNNKIHTILVQQKEIPDFVKWAEVRLAHCDGYIQKSGVTSNTPNSYSDFSKLDQRFSDKFGIDYL